MCLYLIGLASVLAGAGIGLLVFANKNKKLSYNSFCRVSLVGFLLVLCSAGIFGWCVYKYDTRSENKVEINPKKATYENHRYLVFHWNVIHDPNCECRRPFNYMQGKEAVK